MNKLLNQKAKPKFLRAKEVAKDFFEGKVSYNKVLRLTKEGVLPATKIGKIYFYTQEALYDWAERNSNTPVWKTSK